MIRTLTACLALGALATGASAGPLRPKQVDAGAEWLIHVDAEALTSSTLGRYFIEHAADFDIDFAEVEQDLGIDPRTDLFGATLYGSGEDTTILLEMSRRIDEAIEKLKQEDAYQRVESDGRTIHHWDDDGEEIYAYVDESGRQGQRRLVVMAETLRLVDEAVDVLEGDRPSLEGARAREIQITGRPRPGSLIFAFAHGLPWLEENDEPASRIMERSDRVLLELREREEKTIVDLIISARSEKDARDIGDVVRGLLGLARLAVGEAPELRDVSALLETISVSSDKNDITVTLESQSKDLVRRLEELKHGAEEGKLEF